MSDNSISVMVSVLMVAIVLLTGFVVLDDVGGTALDSGGGADVVNDTVLLDGTNWVQVRDDLAKGTNPTVRDSRGFAVRLSGANDSYVETNNEIDHPKDGDFTTGTWAEVNASGDAANQTMTALNAAGELVIQYNGSLGKWSVFYYSASTRDTYRVNVSAPNQPGNLSWVGAVANGTHLTVYRNTTQGEVVKLDGGSAHMWDAKNWNGTIEETSVDGQPFNDSQISYLVSNPNQPRPAGDHRGRLMYDEGSGTSVRVFWTSYSATASNVTWVDGHSPTVMQRAGILGNGDYRWDTDGPRIKPLDGGDLDGAPVAYANYKREELAYQALDQIAGNLELGGVLLIILVATLVLSGVRLQDV